MAVVHPLDNTFWTDAHRYKDAEVNYYTNLSKGGANAPENSLAAQVQKARQQLQNQLQNADKGSNTSLADLVLKLEEDKLKLEKTVSSLIDRISALELTVSKLQGVKSQSAASSVPQKSAAPPPAKKVEEDDDDVDLFGSESEGEDEAAAKIREERLAAYAAKKSKKPVLIAKSNIIFDVKPWDDETDMKQLEGIVRSIEQDGLLWGAAKLVPLAYGIHKLQISCVVEDDKVSVDEIQEKIETLGSEFVQSVDIAAFNKI
ncbi:probable elongation factor 1-delta isoform X2 [Chrysoperla carnea]|uniref:probable elongation factor 1-delta isoform X2 n=1 Tax=Chrysoperla carnea TaxID=189513 RepID=UPI001D0650D9|nr:probable elongation factor 1-delta isoform X2 [Chrysoperla carnea]